MNRLKRLLISVSDPILKSNRPGMNQSIDSIRQTVISHKKKSRLVKVLSKGTKWLRDFNIPIRDEYRKLNVKKTQWQSKTELETLQNKYLRHLIKHAYQNVPFYHNLFKKPNTYRFPSRVRQMFFDFKKNRAWAENLSIVMQIGLTMAGCIVFCFFVGLKIDQWIGTKGIFVTIFTILGVIGGGVTVYRQIFKVIEQSEEEPAPEDTE